MSSKFSKRVIENLTNDLNSEGENDDFDFVAVNNANKVAYIIEKVIEDNENQGFSNVLFDEHTSKTLIKDITEDDLDKLFQMSRIDVCTVNAFLNDIKNTMKLSNISDTIFKQLKAGDFNLNNFNSTYGDMTVEDKYNQLAYKGRFSCKDFSLDNSYFTSELFLNVLTKTLINRPRGEPYIEYQQINEKTLVLIYVIIQFRLNLLSKNQAKKDIQPMHNGDWAFGYKKVLAKNINWEEAINKIKEQCSNIIADNDNDEYYI
ncbi:hypothetical protein BJ944DRAFT_237129 [Cunninghamella echinulata]|nr:hypothetical protein BJ944DRAFT_237129 [Cunninghamella echinulata]